MNPEEEEDQTPPYPSLIGMATRIMRARWLAFLRRVFHHQNGPGFGSGPFDTKAWMTVELVALVIQITVSSVTLAISQKERPVWPMRVWVGGYDVGCVMSLMMLYGKYRCHHVTTTTTRHGDLDLSHVEHQREDDDEEEETRSYELMNKYRSTLELLFAIWFVMGNLWIFNTRLGSFQNAPKLHILCISLLAYNAISYSFPFFLFLLICCFLPLLTALLTNFDDFTISSPSHYHHHHRGASNHQISLLRSWTYHKLQDHGNDNDDDDDDDECCICLAKYKEKEQVRKLPCSHVFHQVCVDQWLRIISCCPLCKQGLES